MLYTTFMGFLMSNMSPILSHFCPPKFQPTFPYGPLGVTSNFWVWDIFFSSQLSTKILYTKKFYVIIFFYKIFIKIFYKKFFIKIFFNEKFFSMKKKIYNFFLFMKNFFIKIFMNNMFNVKCFYILCKIFVYQQIYCKFHVLSFS